MRRFLEFKVRNFPTVSGPRLSTSPRQRKTFSANLSRLRKARCITVRNMTQLVDFWHNDAIHPLHRFVGWTFSRIPHNQSTKMKNNNDDLASDCTRHFKYSLRPCFSTIFETTWTLLCTGMSARWFCLQFSRLRDPRPRSRIGRCCLPARLQSLVRLLWSSLHLTTISFGCTLSYDGWSPG
jgi:hypothetical protein